MADPLSITASVAAVIQLTTAAMDCFIDFKNASRDCSDILLELSQTSGVLSVLRDTLERVGSDVAWNSTLEYMELPNGPVPQLRLTLEVLIAKVKPVHGLRKVGRALMWPLEKKEVAEALSSIERQKTLFILAFQNDSQYVNM